MHLSDGTDQFCPSGFNTLHACIFQREDLHAHNTISCCIKFC
uniref:Uncharacterized protein n=1 Tax=Arundo donax TaxID=35708 RepID=A0A0A8Y604_ARUDO